MATAGQMFYAGLDLPVQWWILYRGYGTAVISVSAPKYSCTKQLIKSVLDARTALTFSSKKRGKSSASLHVGVMASAVRWSRRNNVVNLSATSRASSVNCRRSERAPNSICNHLPWQTLQTGAYLLWICHRVFVSGYVWVYISQWYLQHQILKNKTKITRPRLPEVSKGTCQI